MRLASLRKLQSEWNVDITYVDHYGLKEFVRAVVHDEDNRCSACYTMRLEEPARTAKRMGLDGFTTTLLVSPYQKFETILRVGKEAGVKHDILFFPEDFRPRWGDGMKKSRELGLYRQKYCGCIYSEMEKHRKTADRKREQGDCRRETTMNQQVTTDR